MSNSYSQTCSIYWSLSSRSSRCSRIKFLYYRIFFVKPFDSLNIEKNRIELFQTSSSKKLKVHMICSLKIIKGLCK